MKHALTAAIFCCTPALAQEIIGPGQTYQTPAYGAQIADICAGNTAFPTAPAFTRKYAEHVLATSGTPKIEQYRNGSLIATYAYFVNHDGCSYQGNGMDAVDPGPAAASGCGAFTREHSYRLYQPGDTFLVYPAVYTDQPFIGPQYGDPVTPDNVTLSGVIENNVEPVILLNQGAAGNTNSQAAVYWTFSTNFTLAHIAIAAAPGAIVANAGVFINGATGGRMLDVRVTGFEVAGIDGLATTGADGILGSPENTGTFTLDQVELDHNGGTGTSGINHNAYFATSATDPKYTIVMQRSWSHDAYYGHLFKSRAQVNKLVADYFEGGVPQGGVYTQAEAYGVDIPNGGVFDMVDSVVTKGMSGANSNSVAVTFGEEGNPDGRANYVRIRNNTFVADALTIDGAYQPVALRLAESTQQRILDNVFAGFCPAGTAYGDVGVLALPSDLSDVGGLATPVLSDDAAVGAAYPGYRPIVGAQSYVHALHATARQTSAVGAKD